MFLISHRGNINGRIRDKENHPDYIQQAIDLNYYVEIDVWLVDNKLYLGHDGPQYPIKEEFLENSSLWIHCKNTKALELCLSNSSIHCFWHQQDDYTITSNKHIWCYLGQLVPPKGIVVLPELTAKKYVVITFKITNNFLNKKQFNTSVSY